ncbi:helix-turn-helix domain-containing protein [Pseudarthrobacter sp. J1763]|uniref:helix-turn-helix domain-containing protein n=1 Tax=Pseudarthrobacter sp. J1763 TaxID=3420445 RepID=UPI003D2D2D56
MNTEPLNEQLETALRQLTSQGARISFTAIAAQLGIPRSSLYRNPVARELIHQRITETHADAEKNMAADVNRLRLLIDTLAARVRNHEERLRQLERRPHSTPQ